MYRRQRWENSAACAEKGKEITATGYMNTIILPCKVKKDGLYISRCGGT